VMALAMMRMPSQTMRLNGRQHRSNQSEIKRHKKTGPSPVFLCL
jgi:hypothetical protein